MPLTSNSLPKPGVRIQYSPAIRRGAAASCAARFGATRTLGAAFLHIFNGTCWSCPAGYIRTPNPDVSAPTACARGPQRRVSRATRHRKATGLLHTDCPHGSGQFWHAGDGYCYSCPSGYVRSTARITSPDACFRLTKPRFAKGTERGRAGCPAGSFRNGLFPQCYSCPAGYARSLSIGVDLTKLRDACVRAQVTLPRIHITIPADIGQRALSALGKYKDLIRLAGQRLPADEKTYLATGDLKSVRDAQVEAAAKKDGIKTMSVGVGLDGSSPLVLGGSGSIEVSHSLTSWSGFKKTVTVAGTGAPPALAGAGGTLQLSFLTSDFKSFEGWGLIVNVAAGREGTPWGGGLSASFGIAFNPVRFVFQGFTVSGGAGVDLIPVQGSAGVAYQFDI
jgi:hypothetical protein